MVGSFRIGRGEYCGGAVRCGRYLELAFRVSRTIEMEGEGPLYLHTTASDITCCLSVQRSAQVLGKTVEFWAVQSQCGWMVLHTSSLQTRGMS